MALIDRSLKSHAFILAFIQIDEFLALDRNFGFVNHLWPQLTCGSIKPHLYIEALHLLLVTSRRNSQQGLRNFLHILPLHYCSTWAQTRSHSKYTACCTKKTVASSRSLTIYQTIQDEEHSDIVCQPGSSFVLHNVSSTCSSNRGWGQHR